MLGQRAVDEGPSSVELTSSQGPRALYKGASVPAVSWGITDSILMGRCVRSHSSAAVSLHRQVLLAVTWPLVVTSKYSTIMLTETVYTTTAPFSNATASRNPTPSPPSSLLANSPAPPVSPCQGTP